MNVRPYVATDFQTNRQTSFGSIFYQPNQYRDIYGVKRETQNSTAKRNDLNYAKLSKIITNRFKDYDDVNIMLMNVSDGTEGYYIFQPLFEDNGPDVFEKRYKYIDATDVCSDIIETYPKRNLVHLFAGEEDELSVFRNPMFTHFENPDDKLLYQLKPEYRKYFKYGVQDFQERLANMSDKGNSVVAIRNCLRQSFGDFRAASVVYKVAEKLKGASLFITGGYDRGMPMFESALDDNFVEIAENVWGRKDYKPCKPLISNRTMPTESYLAMINKCLKR